VSRTDLNNVKRKECGVPRRRPQNSTEGVASEMHKSGEKKQFASDDRVRDVGASMTPAASRPEHRRSERLVMSQTLCAGLRLQGCRSGHRREAGPSSRRRHLQPHRGRARKGATPARAQGE